MIINDTIFNCSLNEVLDELKRQLTINKIPYLHTIKDSDDNIHDWHFREVIDPYNCDAAVIRELPEETQNNPEDYILYFYFDC